MSKPGVSSQGIVRVVPELVGIASESLMAVEHLLGGVLDDLGSEGGVLFIGLQGVSLGC